MKNLNNMEYFLFFYIFAILLVSCNKDEATNPDDDNTTKPATVVAEIKEIARTQAYCNLARFSPDGNYFFGTLNQYWVTYSSTPTNVVLYFDIQNNKLLRKYILGNDVTDKFDCAAMSPDGKFIAGGGTAFNGWFGSGVVIWDKEKGTYTDYSNKFFGTPKYIEYTSSGDSMYVYTSQNILYRWDIKRKRLDSLSDKLSLYKCQYFHISGDGKLLLFIYPIKLVDITTNPITVKEIQSGTFAAFLPDYKRLLTTYHDNEISLYDIEQDKVIKKAKDNQMTIFQRIAVSPSGKYFAVSYTLSDDGSSDEFWGVQIWETATIAKIGYVEFADFKYIEFGKDDSKLLCASDYGAVVYEIKYKPVEK